MSRFDYRQRGFEEAIYRAVLDMLQDMIDSATDPEMEAAYYEIADDPRLLEAYVEAIASTVEQAAVKKYKADFVAAIKEVENDPNVRSEDEVLDRLSYMPYASYYHVLRQEKTVQNAIKKAASKPTKKATTKKAASKKASTKKSSLATQQPDVRVDSYLDLDDSVGLGYKGLIDQFPDEQKQWLPLRFATTSEALSSAFKVIAEVERNRKHRSGSGLSATKRKEMGGVVLHISRNGQVYLQTNDTPWLIKEKRSVGYMQKLPMVELANLPAYAEVPFVSILIPDTKTLRDVTKDKKGRRVDFQIDTEVRTVKEKNKPERTVEIVICRVKTGRSNFQLPAYAPQAQLIAYSTEQLEDIYATNTWLSLKGDGTHEMFKRMFHTLIASMPDPIEQSRRYGHLDGVKVLQIDEDTYEFYASSGGEATILKLYQAQNGTPNLIDFALDTEGTIIDWDLARATRYLLTSYNNNAQEGIRPTVRFGVNENTNYGVVQVGNTYLYGSIENRAFARVDELSSRQMENPDITWQGPIAEWSQARYVNDKPPIRFIEDMQQTYMALSGFIADLRDNSFQVFGKKATPSKKTTMPLGRVTMQTPFYMSGNPDIQEFSELAGGRQGLAITAVQPEAIKIALNIAGQFLDPNSGIVQISYNVGNPNREQDPFEVMVSFSAINGLQVFDGWSVESTRLFMPVLNFPKWYYDDNTVIERFRTKRNENSISSYRRAINPHELAKMTEDELLSRLIVPDSSWDTHPEADDTWGLPGGWQEAWGCHDLSKREANPYDPPRRWGKKADTYKGSLTTVEGYSPSSPSPFLSRHRLTETGRAAARLLLAGINLSSNEKTYICINNSIKDTCDKTAACFEYCYGTDDAGVDPATRFSPGELLYQQNSQTFNALAFAPEAEVEQVAKDLITVCRGLDQEDIRWNGIGDLTLGQVRVINRMAALDPDFTIWGFSRKPDVMARLDVRSNIVFNASIDDSTPPKKEKALLEQVLRMGTGFAIVSRKGLAFDKSIVEWDHRGIQRAQRKKLSDLDHRGRSKHTAQEREPVDEWMFSIINDPNKPVAVAFGEHGYKKSRLSVWYEPTALHGAVVVPDLVPECPATDPFGAGQGTFACSQCGWCKVKLSEAPRILGAPDLQTHRKQTYVWVAQKTAEKGDKLQVGHHRLVNLDDGSYPYYEDSRQHLDYLASVCSHCGRTQAEHTVLESHACKKALRPKSPPKKRKTKKKATRKKKSTKKKTARKKA